MSTNNDPTTARTTRRDDAGAAYVAAGEEDRRHISWGAIFAGVVAAVAITILLGLLGAGIGLWSVELGGDSGNIAGVAVGTMIYSIITQLVALFAGGYSLSHVIQLGQAKRHTTWRNGMGLSGNLQCLAYCLSRRHGR